MISIALLNAGVVANPGGPNVLNISGGTSSENQFLVNGVPVMANGSGGPTPLYIEDAVQETTTSVSGISAEYGRFTGGVVNMLTKSGGNDFHASLRNTLTSDKWTAESPLQTSVRNGTINNQYEGTLGGFIVKDRLWFFVAGRDINTNLTGETAITDIPYPTGVDEQRYEGKLTLAITPNHRIIGSYLKVDHTNIGYVFGGVLDLNSVYDRQTPNDLTAVNYTGVLTDTRGPVFEEDLHFRERGLALYRPRTGHSDHRPRELLEHRVLQLSDLLRGVPQLDHPLRQPGRPREGVVVPLEPGRRLARHRARVRPV
jgi:hypothetical protein